MILKPTFAQPSPVSPNYERGENEFGRYIRKTKTVIGKNDNFVKSEIWFWPELHSLTKFNLIGSMDKNHIPNPNGCGYNADLASSSYVTMNSDTGEVLQYGLQFPVPALDPVSDTNYFVGQDAYDPLSVTGLFSQRTIIDKDASDKSAVEIPINTADRFDEYAQKVYAYENFYQMSYHEFIGFINSYFTSHMWNIPIDAYVTIDCVHGIYNVQSFKIANIMSKDKMCEIYKKFLASVSELATLLKRTCEINKRKFEIQVFIGNQNCVVKIRDLVHGAIITPTEECDKYFLTNNDLSAELMKNAISAGVGYLVTDEYCALNECNTSIVDDIMDSTFLDMLEWKDIHYNRI